jgi:hypothetical protein
MWIEDKVFHVRGRAGHLDCEEERKGRVKR